MRSVASRLLGRHKTVCAVVGSVAAALVVIAAVAVGSDVANRGHSPHPLPPHRATHRGAAVVSSANAVLVSDFPVLSRTARASDTLPAGATTTWLPEQRVGANAALARLAANSSEGATYLIPGANSVCVKNTGVGQNFCASADEVEAGVAQEIIICGASLPASDIQVAGLLPSGVGDVRMSLADGTSRAVTVDNGTYAAQFDRTGALPVSISWSAGSARINAPIDVPSRASNETCEP